MRHICFLSLWLLVLGQPQERDTHRLLMSILPFCEHDSAMYSEWLECGMTRDGELRFQSGSFGIVVFGKINREKATGVDIEYVAPQALGGGDGLYQGAASREAAFELPSEFPASIDIVVKVPLDTPARGSQSSVIEPVLLSVEATRSRAASLYQFANGIPFGPASYTVRIRSTGELHPIQNLGYIQEYLHGSTVAELLIQMKEDAVDAVANLNEKMLVQFRKYLALKNEGRVPRPAADVWSGIRQRLRQIQFELRDRTLQRIYLCDALELNLLELWEAGLVHCDAHLRNIMFLKYTARKNIMEVDHLRRIPHHVFPQISIHSDALSKQEEQSALQGIEYFKLDYQSVRYVDTGTAIELKPLLTEIGHEYPGEDPASRLLVPCLVYRGRSHNDLTNLGYRLIESVLETQSDMGRLVSTRLKHGKVKLEFSRFLDWKAARKAKKSFYVEARDAPNEGEWVQLFKLQEELDVYSAQLTTIVMSASSQIQKILDDTNCASMRQQLRRAPELPTFIEGEAAPWRIAHQRWGKGQVDEQSHEAGASDGKSSSSVEPPGKKFKRTPGKKCSLHDMMTAAKEIRVVLQTTCEQLCAVPFQTTTSTTTSTTATTTTTKTTITTTTITATTTARRATTTPAEAQEQTSDAELPARTVEPESEAGGGQSPARRSRLPFSIEALSAWVASIAIAAAAATGPALVQKARPQAERPTATPFAVSSVPSSLVGLDDLL